MGSLIKKLATVEGVKEVHEISTHYVEGKLYVTLHAYVNPELSVEDSHKISDVVEKQIRSAVKQIEHVTVHIEPSNVTITEEEVHDLIEKIAYEAAKNTGEKLQIENVVTYFAEDKRFINVDMEPESKQARRKN